MANEKRKKVLLFYNPHSGDGLFKNNLDFIIEKVQAKGMQLIPVRAARNNMIETAFESIKQEEYRQIIVAGGDGTINICVNSMIRNNVELPLSIFPAGTANDFAYYFGLPHDIEDMLRIAMGEHYTYADVGRCNQKYFVNVAAMGTLVDVSQKTDPNLKNTIGVISYYLKGLSEVPNLKPLPIKLITPEKTYEESMYFMVVMNGKSAGGFKKISPDSDINDGKLDVILFKEMPVVELLPLLVSIFQGKHPKHKKVLAFQTEKLRLESEVEVPTDVDGERGEKFPLEFEVIHKKLKIFTETNNIKEKDAGKKRRP